MTTRLGLAGVPARPYGAFADKVLTATSGTYAYTGVAAELAPGRITNLGLMGVPFRPYLALSSTFPTLSAAQGAYTVTGNAVTLKYNEALTIESIPFAYTGYNVEFAGQANTWWNATWWQYPWWGGSWWQKSEISVLEQGSYTYTGVASTVTKQYKLVTVTDAYNLTGNAAFFTEGTGDFTITAAQGSYAYTGIDAILVATKGALAAATGAYTYTGYANSILYKTIVTADKGSYELTGKDTAFDRGIIVLSPTSGTYALTGNAADFIKLWDAQEDEDNSWTGEDDSSSTWTDQTDSVTNWN